MIRGASRFVFDLFEYRGVIFELAKRDSQQQYFGSLLGLAWTFLRPLMFILVIYMVFTIGLRTNRETLNMPFSLYLVCGMVCWLNFSRTFGSTTGVIPTYSYLVKRPDFRSSVLPIVKILSALFPHAVLLLFAIGLAWILGYPPSIHTLQLVYYVFAVSMLLLGLGWITSSTSVFIKDVPNIVGIITQFGFWLTPIFWSPSLLPEKLRWLVQLNPLNYLVNGYRDSIVSGTPFWDKPVETAYYWLVVLAILVLGVTVFRKLRPEFSEVI